jgi:hypothetical protein
MEPATNIAWKEFFADRSWEIPPGEDQMRPTREFLEPKQLKKVMETFLTHGNSMSRTVGNTVISTHSCDGCPLLSPSHTRPWGVGKTFSNIITTDPPISQCSFTQALQVAQTNGITTPDTLIIGGHAAMFGQAKRIQTIMHDIHHWNFDICLSPALRDEFRYYWFLASRKNSGLHLRDCGHGYFEICAIRWDWIVGSLSKTQPITA